MTYPHSLICITHDIHYRKNNVCRVCYIIEMKRDRIFPLRLSEDEQELVDRIKDKTKVSYAADVFRAALQHYAEKLNIKPPRTPKDK